MRSALLAIVVAACLGAAPSTFAQGGAAAGADLETARAGDAAFDAGDYEQAVARYLESGISSESVHFNLGLAYAHLGRFGEASYHLTQAHFLDLGDGEIQDSLALVRAEADRQRAEAARDGVTLGVPPGIFWLDFFHRLGGLPLDLALVALAWLGFGALLVRRPLAPSARRDALMVVGVACIIALGLGVTYRIGASVTEARVAPGVVTATQPLVYAGPDRSAPRRVEGELSIGAVVLIEERRNDWVRVELSDGRDGWLRDGDIRSIDLGGATNR
jgi:hypothetical protein